MGRLSTVYLLILISFEELHFKIFTNRVGQGTLIVGGKELSTIDLLLLVQISSSQYREHNLLFTKQATLMRRSPVLSLPIQLVFLGRLINNGLNPKTLAYILKGEIRR